MGDKCVHVHANIEGANTNARDDTYAWDGWLNLQSPTVLNKLYNIPPLDAPGLGITPCADPAVRVVHRTSHHTREDMTCWVSPFCYLPDVVVRTVLQPLLKAHATNLRVSVASESPLPFPCIPFSPMQCSLSTHLLLDTP